MIEPYVTVIIPARNEANVIGDCLGALAGQTYPAERFEIVVVDNDSSDGTEHVARESGARVLRELEKSAYAARNTGLAETEGDYVAFTDADCIPAPAWLEELVRTEESKQTGIVAGHISYEVKRDSLGSRLMQAFRPSDVVRRNVQEHHCAPAGNLLIRRSLFEAHGAFKKISSGSDIEFSQRLARAGHPPAYAHRAVVAHQCNLTNFQYLRRSFRVHAGHVQHRPRNGSIGQLLLEVLRFPWRPGFRAVAPIRSAIQPKRPSFLALWAYMWINRFASYAGRVYGTFRVCSHA